MNGPLEDFTKIDVDMLAIGIKIEKKERLGLEVSWSNFPKYEQPKSTGTWIQSVKSSATNPSFLEISIIR